MGYSLPPNFYQLVCNIFVVIQMLISDKKLDNEKESWIITPFVEEGDSFLLRIKVEDAVAEQTVRFVEGKKYEIRCNNIEIQSLAKKARLIFL